MNFFRSSFLLELFYKYRDTSTEEYRYNRGMFNDYLKLNIEAEEKKNPNWRKEYKQKYEKTLEEEIYWDPEKEVEENINWVLGEIYEELHTDIHHPDVVGDPNVRIEYLLKNIDNVYNRV